MSWRKSARALDFGNHFSYINIVMAANSRFAVATHLLASLASAKTGEPQCSKYLASSVNTHPVVVRRIMADLLRADLVKAVPGKHGGFLLARPAAKISLWDVMQAVDGATVFAFNPNPANPDCPVSVKMAKALRPVFDKVQAGVESTLRRQRVQDLVTRLA
jgi:Rrf2 family protein